MFETNKFTRSWPKLAKNLLNILKTGYGKNPSSRTIEKGMASVLPSERRRTSQLGRAGALGARPPAPARVRGASGALVVINEEHGLCGTLNLETQVREQIADPGDVQYS